MRIMIILLLWSTFLFGYNYNNLLLQAQASIFPKILLLDKKIDNKLIDGKIIFTIIYDKNDYKAAQQINNYINENYKNYFDTYAYKINLVEISDFSLDTPASAIYMLNSAENVKKVAEIAKKKGIITFSYDINNLKDGLLFSLMLEKSTVLYLNKEYLYTKKIDFVDALLRMVKFIDSDNS